MSVLTNKTRESLLAAANALNAKSDQLNDTIREFDDFLATAGVGVNVWLESITLADGWQLGYIKLGNKWGVAVRLEDKLPMALSGAPRNVRMDAVSQFEALAITITERLHQLVRG